MSFVMDIREFDQALIQYATATQKDLAEAANRQLNNVAAQSVKMVKDAEKAAIKALEDMEWWPKKIASIMQKPYTRDEARERSRKIIRAKLRAVKFVKGFFYNWSAAIGNMVSGVKAVRSSGGFKDIKAVFTPAVPGKLDANIVVIYDYLRRAQETASQAERILQTYMAAGFAAATADMIQYAEKKMAETARMFSAA